MDAALSYCSDLKEVTMKHPYLIRVLWFTTLVDGAVHRAWIGESGGGVVVPGWRPFGNVIVDGV